MPDCCWAPAFGQSFWGENRQACSFGNQSIQIRLRCGEPPTFIVHIERDGVSGANSALNPPCYPSATPSAQVQDGRSANPCSREPYRQRFVRFDQGWIAKLRRNLIHFPGRYGSRECSPVLRDERAQILYRVSFRTLVPGVTRSCPEKMEYVDIVILVLQSRNPVGRGLRHKLDPVVDPFSAARLIPSRSTCKQPSSRAP